MFIKMEAYKICVIIIYLLKNKFTSMAYGSIYDSLCEMFTIFK